MAQTFSFTDTYHGVGLTIIMSATTGSTTVGTNNNSLAFTFPSHQIKWNSQPSGLDSTSGTWYSYIRHAGYNYFAPYYNTSAKVKSGSYATQPAKTVGSGYTPSHIFTSSNKTTRTVSLVYKSKSNGTYFYNNASDSNATLNNDVVLYTHTYTLDAPPTFTSTVSSSAPYYKTLSSYSVTLSDVSIKFGGDVKETRLALYDSTTGAEVLQPVIGTGNGTLTIPLTLAGTFTPKVSVTDSRNQVTTTTLSNITVIDYEGPTIDFSTARVARNAQPDATLADEGTYALVTANVTFKNSIAKLQTPAVTVKDKNGTSVTANAYWYTGKNGNTLTGAMTFPYNTSGSLTMYGKIQPTSTSHFTPNDSYSITIELTDSIGGNNAKASLERSLATAYYTIDFKAGGHGVAFGAPATVDGFVVAMEPYLQVETTNALYTAINSKWPDVLS